MRGSAISKAFFVVKVLIPLKSGRITRTLSKVGRTFMPNIRSAFVLALNMGRNPSTLSVPAYDSAELYHGDVVGGSQPYHASIDTADGDIDNMRWHCDCPDFRFTFFPHIEENGANIYTFPPPEFTGTGSPRRSSDFGMCKHVMALINTLVHDKVLSPTDFMG